MRQMKDSGIEWIGEIPQAWDVRKGKYILQYLQKPVRIGDEVITCFRDGQVTLRGNRREDGFTMADKEIGYQGIDEGDLVVHGMDGFAGAIGISDCRGKASPVLNVLDTQQNKRYVMFYLRSLAYRDVFLALSTGIRVRSCDLRWNKLAELFYLIPPLAEQEQIVAKIDEMLAKVDALAGEIKEQIATLEEYKRSVITEAVTKGLDASVPMKDSGIEWIGEIPQAWDANRLRNLIVRREGGVWGLEPDDYEQGTICLRVADFNFGKGRFVEDNIDAFTKRKYSYAQILKYKLKKGDILIEKSGGGEKTPVGRAVLFDKVFTALFANFMDRLRFNNEIVNPYFIEYWLRAWYYCGASPYYINQTIGIQNINLSLMLAKQIIFYPSLAEQERIAEFLDAKCAKVDALISEKQNQLATLEEYKKSVIFEYVTGKKEVV